MKKFTSRKFQALFVYETSGLHVNNLIYSELLLTRRINRNSQIAA